MLGLVMVTDCNYCSRGLLVWYYSSIGKLLVNFFSENMQLVDIILFCMASDTGIQIASDCYQFFVLFERLIRSEFGAFTDIKNSNTKSCSKKSLLNIVA